MKKAYLITVYDQPRHLQRLIRALRAPGARFYVHVDKRVDIRPFREQVGNEEGVLFANSTPIAWMGFSQVASILSLMQMAARERCDYYSLLSGSDYPIKTGSQIMNFFSAAKSEYITFWRLEDRPSWMHKIQRYYPIDIVPIQNYQGSGFRRYFWGYFYKLSHYLPKRRYLRGLVPFGGSHWWSLSHDCVSYILRYVKNNPAYVRFYRFTHCPSEMFFQTILMNSDLALRAMNYERYQQWSRTTSPEEKAGESRMLPEDSFNLRYMDWSKERAGGEGRPAILTEYDFDSLMNSEDLFARKFDENISARLLDMIDQRLHLGDAAMLARAAAATGLRQGV